MVAGLFWLVAGLVAVAGLGLALAPLWRGAGRAERRASYDMQVLRDQLRGVEADRARGVLGPAEAAASRTELSRRLLAAAEVEAAERPAASAPRRVSRGAAAVVAGLGLAAAAGLYLAVGAPGMPDQPQAERIAAARAARPSQAAAEAAMARERPPVAPAGEDAALIDRLRTVLADRPTEIEGRRLLARSLAATERWAEARAAQAEVARLLGEEATAQDHVDLAELGIMAAGGYVSPESEAALARALALDPTHAAGRYYSGLALLQAGRPDLAHGLLAGLVAEGPPEAPWPAAAKSLLAEAARQTRRPVPTTPGPDAADLEAAARMTPEERQAMAEGMVGRLGERLAAEGGPPEDWARLIRALGALGRRDEAAEIASEARTTHAGDPAGLAAIEAAARDAGIGP